MISLSLIDFQRSHNDEVLVTMVHSRWSETAKQVVRTSVTNTESSVAMYARLINLSFKQTVAHEDAHRLYQDLVTIFRTIEGFRGYSFMLMPNARRGVTLTFWDDAACASIGGELVLPTICERMGDLLAEAPDVTGYEVIDHVMMDSKGS